MSKTITLILEGKESFTTSKLEQIQHGFNKNNNKKTLLTCKDIFLISLKNETGNIDNLKNILEAKDASSNFDLIVGPRVGTISPWSSKTKDIINNVGIDNVDAIERFYGFEVTEVDNISENDLSSFFDRMTQSIYFSLDECKGFLSNQKKRSIRYIDILANGIEELETANTAFGFAMSTDEIKYLFEFYSNINRNPTDAELMMFAQANSEHCRHKIFNANWTIDGIQQDKTLFDLIKVTSKESPEGIISAYKDNAAITEGESVERLNLDTSNKYSFTEDKLNSTIKVETHNHPTAISPFPGAATGSGG